MTLILWLLAGAAAGLLVPTAFALFRPAGAATRTAHRRPAAGRSRGGSAVTKSPDEARSPWHSVAVVTGIERCEAARSLHEQRFLPEKAPALPLPDCDQGSSCRCRYRRYDDRRSDDRRFAIGGFGGFGGRPQADERRTPGGRRTAD